MVLPRGSESWRRMSRFRRQSLVKPLAAEVLEPRCLMTEATGTLAAADAAPLTNVVFVPGSLWDHAGFGSRRVAGIGGRTACDLHASLSDPEGHLSRRPRQSGGD